MSIQLFCDGCGQALDRNRVTDRLVRVATSGLKVIKVEVLVAVDGTWNAGHVCHACLMRVLNEP